MRDLTFDIDGAEAVPFAAVPTIAFKLVVTNASPGTAVHSAVTRCQIQIDGTRRQYDPAEQRALADLFGEPDRWSSTLRPMLWTHVTVSLPQFTDRCVTDLLVPCSFDFNVAATKYFHGVVSGSVPLTFLFSGTVFHESGLERTLQVAPIPWDKEARFSLDVSTWHDLMRHYYPNGAWLRLRQDAFDRFVEYKRRHGLPTFEETVERLLSLAEDVVPS